MNSKKGSAAVDFAGARLDCDLDLSITYMGN